MFMINCSKEQKTDSNSNTPFYKYFSVNHLSWFPPGNGITTIKDQQDRPAFVNVTFLVHGKPHKCPNSVVKGIKSADVVPVCPQTRNNNWQSSSLHSSEPSKWLGKLWATVTGKQVGDCLQYRQKPLCFRTVLEAVHTWHYNVSQVTICHWISLLHSIWKLTSASFKWADVFEWRTNSCSQHAGTNWRIKEQNVLYCYCIG